MSSLAESTPRSVNPVHSDNHSILIHLISFVYRLLPFLLPRWRDWLHRHVALSLELRTELHQLLVLTPKLGCTVLVRALSLHRLRNQVPLLLFEAGFDLLPGFEEDGIVFFFDNNEVGFETAVESQSALFLVGKTWRYSRVTIREGRSGSQISRHLMPFLANLVPGAAGVLPLDEHLIMVRAEFLGTTHCHRFERILCSRFTLARRHRRRRGSVEVTFCLLYVDVVIIFGVARHLPGRGGTLL